MATIFSKIVNGEIPCHKIAENREFFAFLDIHPLVEGHTLVIPKEEIDYIFDIDDDRLGRMMAFAKKIACAQKQAIPCKRIGMSRSTIQRLGGALKMRCWQRLIAACSNPTCSAPN